MNFQYAVQPSPNGLAQAFVIGREFIGHSSSVLTLGDNIFYGHNFIKDLQGASQKSGGAMVFAYPVHDSERYGVVEFNSERHAISIEEKPVVPKGRYAVTGLYFYDHRVVEIAANLTPSARGEFEFTDVNRAYLAMNALDVQVMGRGHAWLDTETHESMLEASQFIATIEKRQGLKVACPEEVAWRNGWIDAAQLQNLSLPLMKGSYGLYLLHLLNEDNPCPF